MGVVGGALIGGPGAFDGQGEFRMRGVACAEAYGRHCSTRRARVSAHGEADSA
jgi:hypothetical protein